MGISTYNSDSTYNLKLHSFGLWKNDKTEDNVKNFFSNIEGLAHIKFRWYNYHTYKEVYEEQPYWCNCYNNGINEGVPKNKSVCFPSNPEVEFVPMVYGAGYGHRPDLEGWRTMQLLHTV